MKTQFGLVVIVFKNIEKLITYDDDGGVRCEVEASLGGGTQ